MKVARGKSGRQHARHFCAATKMAIRQPIAMQSTPMKVPSAMGHSPAVCSFQPPASIHEKLLASYQKHVFAEENAAAAQGRKDSERGSRNWRAACLANLHKKDYHKARRYWVQLREKERVSQRFCEEIFSIIAKSHDPKEHSVEVVSAIEQQRGVQKIRTLRDLFKAWKYQANTYGFGMSAKMYNIAIASLSQSDPDVATEWLDAMRDENFAPDVITYGMLLNGLSKIGDAENVEKYHNLMQNEDGIAPNAHTFSMVLTTFAHKEDVATCELLLEKMKREGVAPTVRHYNSILHAHSRLGKPQGVLDCMDMMKDSNVDANIVSWNCLLDAYSRGNDAASAIKLLGEIPCQLDIFSYHAVLRAIGRDQKSDVDLCGDYFDKMADAGITPTVMTINIVVDAYARRGLPEMAEKLLEYCDLVDIKPNAVTYNTIITSYEEACNAQKVAELQDAMRRRGIEGDNSVARALLKSAIQDKF
jgi:pentatricopeptide repeat protein